MSKILIIDEKLNSVVIDITPQTIQMLKINQEEIKRHKSKRQIHLEVDLFIKNLQIKNL